MPGVPVVRGAVPKLLPFLLHAPAIDVALHVLQGGGPQHQTAYQQSCIRGWSLCVGPELPPEVGRSVFYGLCSADCSTTQYVADGGVATRGRHARAATHSVCTPADELLRSAALHCRGWVRVGCRCVPPVCTAPACKLLGHAPTQWHSCYRTAVACAAAVTAAPGAQYIASLCWFAGVCTRA